jgi:hypothetical protein
LPTARSITSSRPSLALARPPESSTVPPKRLESLIAGRGALLERRTGRSSPDSGACEQAAARTSRSSGVVRIGGRMVGAKSAES